jgi:NHL repeat
VRCASGSVMSGGAPDLAATGKRRSEGNPMDYSKADVATAEACARRRSIACALALAGLALLLVGVSPVQAAPKNVVGFLGTTGTGTGAGQFSTPRGVAVRQSTGDVYVVDSSNHRIQKFDSMGNFVRTWGRGVQDGTPVAQTCLAPGPCGQGSAGIRGGEFNNPQGIAVDQTDGSVYVTEQNNVRIQKFDADGNFLAAWGRDVLDNGVTATEVCTVAASCKNGATGVLGGEFAGVFAGHPAVNPSGGNVVVADPGNRRVQEFGPDGAFVRAWGWDVQTGGVTTFEICSAAASCKAAAAGGADSGRFGLNTPKRVAVDSAGAVYTVEDTANFRVQKFFPSGGSPALTPSAFADGVLRGTAASSAPTDVAVDPSTNNALVVKANATPAERRVLELSFGGDLLDTHMQGGGLNIVNGLGVHGSSGKIYVSSTQGGDHRVYILAVATPPSATIAPATDVTGDSATLHGTINPNGGALPTGYHFEYSTDGINWTSAPVPDADAGQGTSDVPVSQAVSGLEPNSEYRVRLVARRPFNPPTTSAEQTFTTDPLPPLVTAVGSFRITDTAAGLRGRIDPNNAPTTYRFEYGTDTGYGSTTPLANAGSGGTEVPVSELISGLQPNTTYHFRLVATNLAGETEGPDQTFTTDMDPPQPSGRVYEMVSPPEKNGQDVVPNVGLISGTTRSLASGDAIVFSARGSFAGNPSSPFSPQYLSRRGPDSWSTVGISPPVLPGGGLSVRIPQLSQDLSKAVVRSSAALAPGAWESEEGFDFGEPLYLRDLSSGSYQLLTPEPAPGGAGGSSGPTPYISDFIGANPDLSHGLFESRAELTAEAVPLDDSAIKLYKWGNGTLTLESVLPDGTPVDGSAGGGRRGIFEWIENAISQDGSRVFFSSPADPGGDPAALYVRENGATTLIDPSAVFRGANADGSKVFFTGGGQLKSYDVDSGTTTLLSADNEPDDGTSNIALGLIGFSDDGSRVYFAAQSQLVDGEATASGPKLYLWDEGTVKFITRTSGADPEMWRELVDEKADRRYVTPNGEALLFVSRDPLTGYDNRNPDCSSGACMEVFLYDAGDEELVCVSCDPSGAPPTGNATNGAFSFLAEDARHVSDDGSRAFFASPDPLVPEDVNGKIDVYMWEDGEVELISTGRHTEHSAFADASPSGDDVFFTTSERLVGWDQDDTYDLYDARVGGGLPEPADPPARCVGDECQGQPSGRPALAEPGSAPFRGSGDLAPGPRASFRILRISSAQRSRLARTGRLTIRVRVNRSGKVSLIARAKMSNHSRIVARSSKNARRAGTVKLPLKLSKAARNRLARNGRLRMSLSVRFARVREARGVTLNLRRAAGPASGKGR